MLTIEGRAAALFERACREPLLHRSDRERGPQLDDVAIRSLLPHRRPCVLVDSVNPNDSAQGGVCARDDRRRG